MSNKIFKQSVTDIREALEEGKRIAIALATQGHDVTNEVLYAKFSDDSTQELHREYRNT